MIQFGLSNSGNHLGGGGGGGTGNAVRSSSSSSSMYRFPSFSQHQENIGQEVSKSSKISSFASHSNGSYPEENHSANSSFKWRSMVDNLCIEMFSSTVINLTSIFGYDFKGDNFALQFTPALITGLVMMGLKDEDYYFPDASPLVTLLMWAIGGYSSWVQAAFRLMGHFIWFLISLWICTKAVLPKLIIHGTLQPAIIVFALEAIMTAVLHLSVVYVVVPLLPSPSSPSPSNFTNNNHRNEYVWTFNRVRHKSHKENTPPSNKLIAHASITFLLIYWCMWRTFETEMNPSTTIIMAYVRDKQRSAYNSTVDTFKHNYDGVDIWGRCTIALWGQFVGLLMCTTYTLLFIPRESKIWNSKTS